MPPALSSSQLSRSADGPRPQRAHLSGGFRDFQCLLARHTLRPGTVALR